MKPKEYSAIHVNYATKETTWSSNVDVFIPITDTLGFTRSGSFFTSALIINTHGGEKLLMEEAHYQRLVHSYSQLYEKQLKLTLEEFKNLVRAVIQKNSDNDIQSPYQFLVYGIGGKADTFGGYNSGLSGDISKLIFISNPLASKPEWTFSKGINLLSISTQRPLADAKPTNYVAGVKGQIAINAINAEVIKLFMENPETNLDALTNQTIKKYIQMSESEKHQFRKEKNILRDQKSIDLKSEEQFYEHLIHDSLFMTQDQFILEGPTFSVFGITKENELQLIPLEGNGKKTQDENDGKILYSTSIQCIEKAAEKCNAKIIRKPISLTEIIQLKAFFAVSVTRLHITNETCRLQPIRTIDGQLVPKPELDDPFMTTFLKSISEVTKQ